MTLNINKLNKLQISNSSFKKSNISSYLSTPIEKALKPKKNLKTQPNISAMKIKFNACKPEEYRYVTEIKQKEFEVTVEYGTQIINASFKETSRVEDMKMELFRQMLFVNKNNASQLLNLVSFESC